jgi:hypothetical protein
MENVALALRLPSKKVEGTSLSKNDPYKTNRGSGT